MKKLLTEMRCALVKGMIALTLIAALGVVSVASSHAQTATPGAATDATAVPVATAVTQVQTKTDNGFPWGLLGLLGLGGLAGMRPQKREIETVETVNRTSGTRP